MDSVDLDTRLPPRKRLLAGLRKENCDIEYSLPDSKIFGNLRILLSGKSSSTNEILEASRSAVSAAVDAAAAARALAIQKAKVAVKAKEAAKSALEFLALVSGNVGNKPKLKTKHVPIKLLYKNKLSKRRKDDDEVLARKTHDPINSRRIQHNVNIPLLCAKNCQSNGHPLVIVGDDGGSACSKDKNCRHKVKKMRSKRRKLLISECSAKDQEPQHESSSNKETVNKSKVPTKITTMLRCKKIKVSQPSSDKKMLPSALLSPAPAETSAQ